MLSVPTPSIVDQRRDQILPKLNSLQIERVRRFGEVRSFAAGERIMTAGEVAPGLVVVLAGRIAVAEHTDLDLPQLVIRPEQGDFLGELAQLAGRPALMDATAEGAVEALIIPPERLRALMIAEAELGELIMRALILRRMRIFRHERAVRSSSVAPTVATSCGCKIFSVATVIPITCSIRKPTHQPRR